MPGFAQTLKQFQNTVLGGIARRHGEVAGGLLARLVDRTPVASGRARGNWLVGRGRVPVGESGRPDRDGAATLAAGQNVIDRAGPGETLHLVNRTPYIAALEHGSGTRAPAAMVRLTVIEFADIVAGTEDRT
ncbi:hypothetical protein [Oceanibacterium hippocampi]|uniref:HK97 gp10 family phage protein n=1 Tax=Oceanibacterium hippocampi TaxID=745714 RepID=A0A1Y5S4W5_9PROT|nr:hypothetical protein [Oceanibacterium hippocampi]SLN31758.1 hypothetical protein OCH7691_01150 [Oceanibacterium hippocampi]